MKYCYTCINYNNCTSLCATAERYVDQDHVSNVQFPNAMLFPEGCERYWGHRLTLDTVYYLEDNTNKIPEVTIASIDLSFLPPNKRTVIELFYIEGKTVKEVAEQLEIGTGTVRRYLWSARQKIKDHYLK